MKAIITKFEAKAMLDTDEVMRELYRKWKNDEITTYEFLGRASMNYHTSIHTRYHDFDPWYDWFVRQISNDLPETSSGSFWTALNDRDYLESFQIIDEDGREIYDYYKL